MAVYSLIKKKETEELHLFESQKDVLGLCRKKSNSVCKAMNLSEKESILFECLSEKDVRLECAKIGRQVCGNCIKSLYATYSEVK